MTTGVTMTKAAVIAHLDKRIGGGLDEFRGLLQAASPGFRTTRRPEMSKSTMARTGSADLFAESLHVLADLEAAADSALRSEALPTSNVGTLLGGVHAFADALPIPGRLGVATAEKFKIELKSKMPWGVDGGDSTPTEIFEVRCHSGAARVCQPDGAA